MKNVLIIGGAGFIGSSLSLALLERDYEVTVLDNLSGQIHGDDPDSSSYLYNSIKGKVRFIHGSVTSRESVRIALQNQDAIIHLAAETGTGQSMYEIEKYTKVNVLGTSILLDVLSNEGHSVKKIIVASSRAIYGEGKYWSRELNNYVFPEGRNDKDLRNGDFEPKWKNSSSSLSLVATDEASKIHPNSVYGITKQIQEQLIMTVCPNIGIAPVAFRYQNVYGPGQSLLNPYTGILSIFSSLILSGKKLNIFEDGLESRDFVYISDVVDATILGLENEKANGEVFNVGTGVSTTVLEVAETLYHNYNEKSNYIISGNFRLGDIRHNYADLAKINSMLGFVPRYSFEQGSKYFCDWVLLQNIEDNSFEKSIGLMKDKGLFK